MQLEYSFLQLNVSIIKFNITCLMEREISALKRKLELGVWPGNSFLYLTPIKTNGQPINSTDYNQKQPDRGIIEYCFSQLCA